MKRIVVAAALSVGAVLAIPLPASAVPPVRVVSEVFDADVTVVDEFLTAECGFTVAARVAGHYRETEFYNQDGSLDRVTAHPSFRSALTSPTGTITTADVGLDRFIENEDGTIRVGTRKDSERRVRARGVDLGPALIAGGRWNLIRTRGTRLPCCHQQGGVPVRDRFAWELHRRLEALAPHADA
jgi:hypothetical protein